jgi:uncharacterized lipoprotein
MKMRNTTLLITLALLSGMTACSGDKARSCDDVQKYQLAAEGERIETPDDLDDLDPLREMPLPEASPRPPRPEGSPCIDLPPSVLSGQ